MKTERLLTPTGKFVQAATLSSNDVTAFASDCDGLMWVGTSNGLNSYDGSYYTQYMHVEGDTTTIPGNNVKQLLCDSKGRLWVGTTDGLACYTSVGRFKNYKIGNSANGITQIMESGDGHVFVSNGISVYKLSEGRFERFYTFRNTQSSLQAANFFYPDYQGGYWVITPRHSQHFNRNGHRDQTVFIQHSNMVHLANRAHLLWIAQSRYLSCIDLRSNKVLVSPDADMNFLPTVLCAVDDGLLLKSDRHGLFRYKLSTGSLDFVSEEELPLVKRHVLISSIVTPNSHDFWVGYQNGGMQIVNDAERLMYNVNNIPLVKETTGKGIFSLAQFGNWIMGFSDTHIVSCNKTTGQTEFMEQTQVLTDAPYYRQIPKKIIRIDDENAWLLTNVRIVNCKVHEGRPKVKFSLRRDSDAMFGDGINVGSKGLFNSGSGNLLLVDRETAGVRRIPVHMPGFSSMSKLLQLHDGRVLVFMDNMELALVDTATWRVTPAGTRPEKGLQPAFAYEDSKQRIWLGTSHGGLYQLDLKKRMLKKVDYVNNNHMASMTEAPDGRLWIGTNDGIVSVIPDRNEAFFYSIKLWTDLNPRQFNIGCVCPLSSEKIIFGSMSGCTVIPIAKMKPLTNSRLRIRNISVMKENATSLSVLDTICNGNHYTFKYNYNDLRFSCGTINYGGGAVCQCEYKLEGYNNEWNVSERSSTIDYANLPPGDYVFRIRTASPVSGVKHEECAVRISINPAPWFSWPAFILYALVALGFIIYINSLYLRIKSNKMQLQLVKHDRQRERHTNEMNMRFFANISHEFRNPLTLISGPINMLKRDGSLPSGARNKLSVVSHSVNRMLVLIDQMLDFNKLENDVLRLRVTMLDISYELNRLYELFRENTQERDIRLSIEGTQSPCYMFIDRDKLYKITANLFTNALKHTSDGGAIKMSVSVIPETEAMQQFPLLQYGKGSFLLMSVYNDGRRIPADRLSHIFKRYYQVQEVNNAHQYGFGNGIGLYYVNRLVELHHGAIKVENTDSGVRFSFVLPMNEEAYARDEKLNKEELPQSAMQQLTSEPVESRIEDDADAYKGDKRKILIVDDDTEMARYLRMLMQDDFLVISKYDAESALAEMETIRPDIILSDVVMGDMDGYEFCRKIKENLSWSHIPVILITAKSNMKEQIEGLDVGAAAYVTKPFDPAYLRSLVRSQLRNCDNIRNTLSHTSRIDAVADVMSGQDKEFMRELHQLMDKHIQDFDLNLNVICEEMRISRSKFNYKIKALTGMTPNNYFNGYKLNKAASLLREGKYSVSEVSAMTGFNTISYFSTSFKKHFGVTPSEYK